MAAAGWEAANDISDISRLVISDLQKAGTLTAHGAHIGNLAASDMSQLMRETDNAVNRLSKVVSDRGGVHIDIKLPNFWEATGIPDNLRSRGLEIDGSRVDLRVPFNYDDVTLVQASFPVPVGLFVKYQATSIRKFI